MTLGDVLFSLLDAESYPWEQIDTAAIDPLLATDSSPIECVGGARCGSASPFRFVFDVGPGEPTLFEAPTATVTLPAGTRPSALSARGSGPGISWNDAQPYDGPVMTDGARVTVPMADTQAGTVFELFSVFSTASFVSSPRATATLTTGSLTASEDLTGDRPTREYDDPTNNWSPQSGWEQGEDYAVTLREGSIYYEWISPAWVGTDDEGRATQGPAQDEDYYYVEAPGPGQRLVVSTNASDGQISLGLYAPTGSGTSAASLGLASAGPVPGTIVTEQPAAAAAGRCRRGHPDRRAKPARPGRAAGRRDCLHRSSIDGCRCRNTPAGAGRQR